MADSVGEPKRPVQSQATASATTAFNRALATVLGSGAWLSVALVSLGLIVILIRGEEQGALRHSSDARWILFHAPGVAIVSAGMIVLVASPLLREATALVLFVRGRDYAFARVAGIVLFLVVVSLVIGAR